MPKTKLVKRGSKSMGARMASSTKKWLRKKKAVVPKMRVAPSLGSMRATAAAAPVAIGTTTARQFSASKSEIVRGTDFLTTITSQGHIDGAVLYNWYCSPSLIPGRCSLISKGWERYQFKQLRFEYIPCVGTSSAGSLTMAYDPDCSDVTPAATASRAQLYAKDDVITSNVWGPAVLNVRGLDKKTLYYCGSNGDTQDERLELQGQFYVAYTGSQVISAVTYGTIMVQYEIEFSKRCFEEALPTAGASSGSMVSQVGVGIPVVQAVGLIKQLFEALPTWSTDPFMSSKGYAIASHMSAGLEFLFNLAGIQGAPGRAGAYVKLKAFNALGQELMALTHYLKRMTGNSVASDKAGDIDYTIGHCGLFTHTSAAGANGLWDSGVEVVNDTSETIYVDIVFEAEGAVCDSYALKGLSIVKYDVTSMDRVWGYYLTANSVMSAIPPPTVAAVPPSAVVPFLPPAYEPCVARSTTLTRGR